MKKFLFILLLIPAIASLGHDVYLYSQNMDKGFRLTDLGKLWDMHHKESHDQWKKNIDNLSETVTENIEAVLPQNVKEQATEEKAQILADFQQGFSQHDDKEATKELAPPPRNEQIKQEKTNDVKKFVGFLLEQKAVFVFAAIPAGLYILNLILSILFRKKEKGNGKRVKSSKKQKYAYGRK